MAFQYLKGAHKQEGNQLFTWVDGGFKLKGRRFRIDVRGKFFTERVVRCWHRMPRETVVVPSLDMFKAKLNVALGSLI